tara:strand:+ start:4873 stop:5511 length:639 start_codon:yes stop_codon:yes gene_type:complete
MHIAIINEYKIAFFWSPKTGHSTMFKILKDNFCHNSTDGPKTHSEIIPSNISDFTFILLYRNPLERLVSSFMMPQVPQNICFKEFILNYTKFHDHHQCPQTKGGPGIDILKKSNKTFDYTINTKNLNVLPVLIEKLTGKNIQKNIRENVLKRLPEEQIEEIEYYNIKKSFFIKRDIGIPKWEKFYNEELKIIAINNLKSDYDFFKSIGIESF